MTRPMSRLFGILAVAILSWSREAGATGIAVEAPPECAGRERLILRVREIAGADIEGFSGAVRIERTPKAWHAALTFGDETRELDGESCEAVTEATALVFALAFQAKPRSEAVAPAPPGGRPRAREEEKGAHFAIALGPALDIGALPAAGFGPQIDFSLQGSALRADLFGGFFFPRDGLAGPGKGAELSLVRVGLRGCYSVRRGALEVGPCLSIAALGVRAVGFGSSQPETATAWLVDFGAGPHVAIELGGPVFLNLDAVLAIRRPQATFVIEGGAPVHRTNLIGLSASLAAEVRF